MTFDFQGSATVKGSTWAYAGLQDPDLPDSTCTEYGASMLKSTKVGVPHLTKPIGGQDIDAQFDSTWPPPKAGIVDFPASGHLRVGSVSYEARNSNTTGQVTLQENGSGKYTLNKLVHTEGGDTDVTGSISGTISWTCMEPQD